MDIIDRYLQAVKFALPKSQADDIVRELSDNILSQVEERESELGRPVTEDEIAEMLKKLGSPAKLASQYREQQGLIGPVILPIYWKVLKTALALALVVQVIAAIAMAAAGKPLLESLAPVFRYPNVALLTFAWITLAFAVFHFLGGRLSGNQPWDPRKLPPIIKSDRRKSRTEVMAGLVVGGLASVWWLYGLHHPFWIFGPGVAFMTFGPVWLQLFPLFVLMAVAEVIRHAYELARPYAIRKHAIARLTMRGLNLVVLFFLIRAKDVFVASNPANPQMQDALTSINYALHLGLMIAAVVTGVKLVADVWKLIRTPAEQARQATARS